jgi:hypothetical protein
VPRTPRKQPPTPEIQVEPGTFMGRPYVSADSFINSPDIKVVYNSGSNYWKNLLSKYD